MSNLLEPPFDSMSRISAVELRQVRQSGGLRTVEHFVDLGSTNDRARRLLAIDGIELPALVVTDHQTAGRGRGPNSWWATRGALTFSLIIRRPLTEQPNRARMHRFDRRISCLRSRAQNLSNNEGRHEVA